MKLLVWNSSFVWYLYGIYGVMHNGNQSEMFVDAAVCFGQHCASWPAAWAATGAGDPSMPWQAALPQPLPAQRCCDRSELSWSAAHPSEVWNVSQGITDIGAVAADLLHYREGNPPLAYGWRPSKRGQVPPLLPLAGGTRVKAGVGWRQALRRGNSFLSCSTDRGEAAAVLRTFFTHTVSGRPLLGASNTFLEIGGLDGTSTSNTLVFERCLGWRGVLVEAGRRSFEHLKRNRRESLNLRVAACEAHGAVRFAEPTRLPSTAGVRDEAWQPSSSTAVEVATRVACGPLGDYLHLLNVRRIDFFSLDVEGSELAVLRSLNATHLSVGVLLVEVRANGERSTIMSLLLERGFMYVGQIDARGSAQNAIVDDCFVNASHLARHFPCSRAVPAAARDPRCQV